MARPEDVFSTIKERGEAAIEEFVRTRASEELFLDFKRSSDDGKGNRLSDNDRSNLAKAISGFGNSEGGVVVWGVDCSRDTDGADVAKLLVPITNVRRFVSWLQAAISGCTVPPHDAVQHLALPREGSEDGYVITLIPKSSHAPHQVVPKLQYFMRAGSSFAPVPHSILAGMFGRRPQPDVFHAFAVAPARWDQTETEKDVMVCDVGVMLRNEGPGIASDLFVNLECISAPGPDCALNLRQGDATQWTGVFSFQRHISLISVPGYRLPPEAHTQPLIITARLTPPFSSSLQLVGMVGAGNSMPRRFGFKQTASEIDEWWTEFSDYRDKGTLTEKRARDVTLGIFKTVE